MSTSTFPDEPQRPSDPEQAHPSQAEGEDPDAPLGEPDPEPGGHPSQAEGEEG
ncbi:hypothetical protein N8K70_13920 [Microbacterium betulae]|uniref:Uncharacterized protein n=1 Tax=Microbacterium betulae TaxID=2981139 RepID=A0AA97FJ37_9MICO|nr:hypothetical protein [Microbacterium sp. AB]WOF22477.1 hypothetical protein N8K70_13920 [Microbacterium sp. AB]